MYFIRSLQPPIHVISMAGTDLCVAVSRWHADVLNTVLVGVAREGKSAFLSIFMRIVQGDHRAARPATGQGSHLLWIDRSGGWMAWTGEMETKKSRMHFQVNDGVKTETEGAWIWGTNRSLATWYAPSGGY